MTDRHARPARLRLASAALAFALVVVNAGGAVASPSPTLPAPAAISPAIALPASLAWLAGWRVTAEAGVAASGYFGSGWQEALATRASDDPLVATAITSGSLLWRPAAGVRLSVPLGRRGTASWTPAVALGAGWARLGGVFRYESGGERAEQLIARDYLVVATEAELRRTVQIRMIDRPLFVGAAAGAALLVPYGGMLVETRVDDSVEREVFAASGFRAVVPAGTVRLGASTPLGPGRLGLSARGVVSVTGIEPDARVWLAATSVALTWTLAFGE